MVCEISSLWISFQVLRENWSVDDILEQGRFEFPTVYFFTNEITSYDVGGLRALRVAHTQKRIDCTKTLLYSFFPS